MTEEDKVLRRAKARARYAENKRKNAENTERMFELIYQILGEHQNCPIYDKAFRTLLFGCSIPALEAIQKILETKDL